jgi:hypothetical protein
MTSSWSNHQDLWDATSAGDGGTDPRLEDAQASGYAKAILEDHPSGYWTLDETEGTVAHDSSGNGNDGRLEGAVAWKAESAIGSGTGATFDGGDIVVGNDGTLFGFTNKHPFSIEAWVRPTKLDDLYRRIVAKERPKSPRDGYTVWLRQGAPQPVIGFELLVGDVGTSSVAPFRGGAYVHVVVVHEAASSAVYLDGALATSGPMDLALVEQPGPLTWGGTPFSAAGSFVGALDELAVYDHALPPQAVAAHYAARGH